MITIVFPAIVALMYVTTGIIHALRGEWGWSLTWVSYGIANVGLILAQIEGG